MEARKDEAKRGPEERPAICMEDGSAFVPSWNPENFGLEHNRFLAREKARQGRDFDEFV